MKPLGFGGSLTPRKSEIFLTEKFPVQAQDPGESKLLKNGKGNQKTTIFREGVWGSQQSAL